MTTHLTQIGNSFGVRIPKAILTQLGFDEHTDLSFKVTKKGLLISPVQQSREGWAEDFHAKKKRQSEPLLLGEDIINEFDQNEWQW